MADWYVDSAATGTNSGDSPANAAWNIRSLTYAANSAGVMPGDRVWVRRTWCATATNFIGRSGWNPNSQPYMYIIGWPNSGDPFYDERPAAGISAGWDADVGEFTNVPYPYFSTSRGSSPTVFFQSNLRGWHLTNFAVVASNGHSYMSFGPEVGQNYGKLFLWNHRASTIDAEEIVLCTSTAETNGVFQDIVNLGRVHVTASCNITTALFENGVWVGEVFVDCTSVEALQTRNTGNAPANYGVIRGNPFNRGDVVEGFAGANTKYIPVHIEDWFGSGPRRLSAGLGGYTTWVANSVTASYSGVNSAGANATAMRINSHNAGTQSAIDLVGLGHAFGGAARDTFVALSGTTYEATVAVYITRASCVDAFKNGYLQVRGAASKFARTHVQPGTPARWQGQSIGAGSAYIMRTEFTAFETGTVHLSAWPGTFVNPQTCYVHIAPFFEVTTV